MYDGDTISKGLQRRERKSDPAREEINLEKILKSTCINHKLLEFSTSLHDCPVRALKKHLIAKYKNRRADIAKIKHSQHAAVNKLSQCIRDPKRN